MQIVKLGFLIEINFIALVKSLRWISSSLPENVSLKQNKIIKQKRGIFQPEKFQRRLKMHKMTLQKEILVLLRKQLKIRAIADFY